MKLISCLVAGLFIASPVLADNVLKPGGSADGWTLDKAENVTDGGTGTFRMKNENNQNSDKNVLFHSRAAFLIDELMSDRRSTTQYGQFLA